MSTFGSAVINKSSKKIAPKAAAQRRRPAANQAPQSTSTRASVESQTPQPASDAVAQPSETSSVTAAAPSAPTSLPTEATQPVPSSARTTEVVPVVAPSDNLTTSRRTESQSAAASTSDGDSVQQAACGGHPTATRAPRVAASSVRVDAPKISAQPRDQTVAIEPPAKRRRVEAVRPPAVRDQPRTTRSRTGGAPRQAANVAIEPPQPSSVPQNDEPVPTTEAIDGPAVPVTKKGRKTKTVRARRKTAPTNDTALPSEPAAKAHKRRRRERTPEDAETIEIAPTTMKMSDLCRDIRTGKKSTRQRELEKLDANGTTKRRRQRQPPPSDAQPANGTTSTPTPHADPASTALPPPGGHLAAPQLRVVNGRIVVDDQSLQIDRHAAATAAAPPMESVVENELTRRITSGSWLKRSSKEAWDDDTLDLFYQGLRMFGTDFEIISKMLPGKTRRHVKNKFVKEERANLERINEALVGGRTGGEMDLQEYSRHTKVEYDEVERFERELEDEARRERELEERLVREAGEVQRRRRRENDEQVAENAAANAVAEGEEVVQSVEEVVGEAVRANEDESGGTGRRGKAAKGGKKAAKPKKNMVRLSRHGGGEEVEVVGTVEGLMGAA